MTELKATPGPWEIHEYTNYVGWSIYAPNAGCIAERWYSHSNFRMNDDLELQMRANAHLIAESWNLYHLLEDALEELRLIRMKDTDAVYDPTLRTRISAGLARARGEL